MTAPVRFTPQVSTRIAVGIALVLIVIGTLAIIGHSSVTDAGVNAGVRTAGSVRHRIARHLKRTAKRAAVAA